MMFLFALQMGGTGQIEPRGILLAKAKGRRPETEARLRRSVKVARSSGISRSTPRLERAGGWKTLTSTKRRLSGRHGAAEKCFHTDGCIHIRVQGGRGRTKSCCNLSAIQSFFCFYLFFQVNRDCRMRCLSVPSHHHHRRCVVLFGRRSQ